VFSCSSLGFCRRACQYFTGSKTPGIGKSAKQTRSYSDFNPPPAIFIALATRFFLGIVLDGEFLVIASRVKSGGFLSFLLEFRAVKLIWPVRVDPRLATCNRALEDLLVDVDELDRRRAELSPLTLSQRG
jgi:hypothetical protein